MHCSSCLQAGRRSPKVAVLDTIHGGTTIAYKMVESGIGAEALEVYHHSPSITGFDLVVAPVHLSPKNPVLVEAKRQGKKILTHHQAVGELLGQHLNLGGIEVFEVTGTHSKTSTALLLAKMLSSQKKVVSHTTRGLELWREGDAFLLRKGLSITPANEIPAASEAEAQGADALISEVSLGGTGLADWGIMTSLSGDYRIAGGTKWASTAKLQMVSLAKKNAKLAANADAHLSPNISFGAKGVSVQPDKMIFGKEEQPIALGEDLDFPGYQTALAGSVATAHAAGISLEDISEALQGFDGFSGRMKVLRSQGLTIFDSSNSGLKVRDVGLALDRASGGRLGVVVGEESETVCEGMNIPALMDLLRQRRGEIGLLVLVGERLRPWAGELKAATAQDLASGYELAKAEAGYAGIDRLLLCVKCFR